MKVGCVMLFPTERTRRTSDNERLSRGRVIREKVTILWVLLDMPTDRLVYFENIEAEKA
jgi:hypothetical protein